MFGFIQTTLDEAERGQAYPVVIGYIKRPPAINDLLRGDISVDDGGSASKQLCMSNVYSYIIISLHNILLQSLSPSIHLLTLNVRKYIHMYHVIFPTDII